jgi:hypothetical protein
MSIRDMIFGKSVAHKEEEERPVVMVQERENVWRIVYAD